MKKLLRAVAVLAVLALSGCNGSLTDTLTVVGTTAADAIEHVTGPSSAAQLNIFAGEEKAATIAENLAATWAESGTETATQAQQVEAVRVPIDQALADGRKARDAGNNVLLAQAISALKTLTPKLTALLPAAYKPPR